MKGVIFTYFLTYGGAAVSLYNPFVGLLVYVCFAVLRPQFLWPVPPGNYSRVVAIALLVGWAFKGFGTWRFGRGRIPVILLLLYVASMIFSTRYAIDPDAAWQMVELTVKIALPFLVGLTTINSVRQLRMIAWVVVLSEGYLALEFNLSYLAGYNRLRIEGFGTLDNNGNAVALVCCAIMAMFLALHSDRRIPKAVAAAAGLFMLHAIMFSFSRGGMVSMMIASLIAAMIIPKKAVHYAIFALLALLVIRFAGDQVIARFAQAFITGKGQEASADSRLNQWAAARDSMWKRPLGVGPDQWKLYSQEYDLPLGQAVHSTWIQVGVELGIPALLFLLGFYGTCFIFLWPLARDRGRVPDPWIGHLARMVIASLVGFGIGAQFVTLHLLEIPYFTVLIGVGLLKLEAAARDPTNKHVMAVWKT